MRSALWALIASLLLAVSGGGETVTLEYIDGISELTTSCCLQAIKLSGSESAGEALIGDLRLAGRSYPVSIRPRDGGADLAVDLTGDGSLSPIEWDRVLGDGTLLASPEFALRYSDSGQSLPYRIYLMWNPWLPTVVTFCRDNYRTGTLELGGRHVPIAVVEDDSDGRYDRGGMVVLFVDVDGDGRLLTDDDSHERFELFEPFRIAETTYVISAIAPEGTWLEVSVSENPIEPKNPLLMGFPAPSFEGRGMDGGQIDLASFRGRIVVLDFWASWCRSCLAELAGMEAIHARFAGLGITVLAISVDREESAFRQTVWASGVSYPQIYDGDEGPIAAEYRIGGIPMTYLIDRDGIIRGKGLRGEELIAAIEALLNEEGAS